MLKRVSTLILVTAVGFATPAMADKKAEKLIEYRQAVMKVVGFNFKPMGDMAKGDMDWDTAKFQKHAEDLGRAAQLEYLSAYPEDTEEGKTRAKPDVWLNFEDFSDKMKDFTKQATQLAEVSRGGDKNAMMKQFKNTAKTCKSCHKEYKSKNYLH